MSILLESHEIIDTSIAQRPASYIAKVSRKRHAGHFAFCRNDARTTFSLAVPTSESPEFQTTGSKFMFNVYYLLTLVIYFLFYSETTVLSKVRIYHNRTSII